MRGVLDTIQKQDRLPANKPYAGFYDMYDEGVHLHAAAGYTPLMVQVRRNKSNKDDTVLLLERALPPEPFLVNGREVVSLETEGQGGHVFYQDANYNTVKVGTGVQWLTSGMTVTGATGIISVTKVQFGAMTLAPVTFSVISSAGILTRPLFRLRRQYDTVIAAAAIGVGDGSKQLFTATIANTPICPGSVKIDVGASADVIRDDGNGRLIALPPDLRLGGEGDSIDYVTGAVVLSFSADYIPPAVNITMDYEYSSDDLVEHSEYDVRWTLNR